jgi:hypothetical protein
VSITGRATDVPAAPATDEPGDVSSLPDKASDTDDSQQLLEYLLQNGGTSSDLHEGPYEAPKDKQ